MDGLLQERLHLQGRQPPRLVRWVGRAVVWALPWWGLRQGDPLSAPAATAPPDSPTDEVPPPVSPDGSPRADAAPRAAEGSAAPPPPIGDDRGLGRTLLVPALTSLFINLLGLAVPLALLQIYNRIIPYKATATLGMLVAGVLGALAVEGGLRILRTRYVAWVGARFEHRTSIEVFSRLLAAEPRELERADGAKHLERMAAIQTISELYSGQALLALFDLPFLLLYLYLIHQLAGPLVLVPLAAVGVITFISLRVGGILNRKLHQDTDFNQRRFSFITETLNRVHTVKAMAMEAQMLRRYEMLQVPNIRQTHDLVFLGSIMPALSAFTSQATTALVIGLGALAVMEGELSTGGLAACTLLAGRTLQPLQTLVAGLNRLQAIRLAKAEVEALRAIPQRAVAPATEAAGRLTGGLRLEDLSFGYHPERPVLNHLDLEVAPGECIAVVAENGGGKTTFLKCLAGRLAPTGGRVLVDGVDLAALPSQLRGQIGMVPQYGTLFNGTILQNLTMFDDTRRETALRVATRLGLDTTVSRMPKGYQTVVGDGASDMLPAGVVQRISIVRALTMEPRIILFDEANMAIDAAGDKLLREFLEELKGRSTLILISQRPSFLRMADRCFMLEPAGLRPLADPMELFRRPPPPAVAASEGGVVAGEGGPAGPTPPNGDRSWQEFLELLPSQSVFLHLLKHLLNALRWQGSSRRLAEALPHLFGALDLTGLCNAMANLQYHHRTERGRLAAVDPRLAPFLFVPDRGEPVVVEGDGAGGLITRTPAGESASAEGMATEGTAYLFLAPQPDAPRPPSWFRAQLARFLPLIWMIMGVTLLGNVMAVATPLFTMTIYDRIIPSGSREMGAALLVGVLLAVGVDAVMRVQRVRLLAYIGAKAERLLSSSILERLLAMPPSLTERVAVGVQLARIKSLEVIRDMFIGPLAHLYYDAPTTLFFLVVLAVVNPSVILFMLLLMAILGLVGSIVLPLLQQRTGQVARVLAQRQAFLGEALHRIQVIQSSHAEEIWYQRFRELSGKSVLAGFQLNQITTYLATFSHVMTMAAAVGAMAVTAGDAIAGTQTSGAVVATMILTWRIFSPIQTTFLGITKMVQIVNSTKQIDRLMEIRGERDPHLHQESGNREPTMGAVSFFRVSFRYSNDAEPALVGVTFQAPPGSVVAVIGANGSGKSTLIKMILGLYTPQAGSVMIDNSDIRQGDPLALRQAVAYVPQVCDIFFGTVAQNLRLVDPDASDAELEEATARAGLLEEIRRLPEGFGTRLHESRSEQLSTGFKQRLSLARAYLKRSPIILFDEPSNNLDPESENLFLEAVAQMRGRSTMFIVTHRPSHLKIADLVLYLEAGYLRAAGSPDQVRKLLPAGFI